MHHMYVGAWKGEWEHNRLLMPIFKVGPLSKIPKEKQGPKAQQEDWRARKA